MAARLLGPALAAPALILAWSRVQVGRQTLWQSMFKKPKETCLDHWPGLLPYGSCPGQALLGRGSAQPPACGCCWAGNSFGPMVSGTGRTAKAEDPGCLAVLSGG